MLRSLTCCGVAVALLVTFTAGGAQEKKDDAPKQGKVVGILVGIGKEKKAIEVKADGEEKARIYVPHWVGGLPADGGGPDKKMLAIIAKLRVGSRVEVKWEFEERLRVVEVKVLKLPADDKKSEESSEDVRKGKTVGILVGKSEKFIEVRGDGEEKPRKYHPRWLAEPKPAGFDPEILKQFQKLTIGSRLQLDWVSTNHGPMVHELRVLKAAVDGK